MYVSAGVQARQDEWFWRTIRCGGDAGATAEGYHASYHKYSSHAGYSFSRSPVRVIVSHDISLLSCVMYAGLETGFEKTYVLSLT